MGRDDGRAMQAVKVFRTGMPRPFTDVAEAEFQILDSKDIALADTTGELPRGVDLPRSGHTQVHFAQQRHAGFSPRQQVRRVIQILAPLGVPKGDSQRVRGRREGGRRWSHLDAVQRFRRLEDAGVHARRHGAGGDGGTNPDGDQR